MLSEKYTVSMYQKSNQADYGVSNSQGTSCKPRHKHLGPRECTEDKRASLSQPLSPRLDARVHFYFLAFFAFFFFTIVSSFCSDIGNSEVCLSR
jgi:hypothetical protein